MFVSRGLLASCNGTLFSSFPILNSNRCVRLIPKISCYFFKKFDVVILQKIINTVLVKIVMVV